MKTQESSLSCPSSNIANIALQKIKLVIMLVTLNIYLIICLPIQKQDTSHHVLKSLVLPSVYCFSSYRLSAQCVCQAWRKRCYCCMCAGLLYCRQILYHQVHYVYSFLFFSTMFYHKILNIVLCAIHQDLVVYPFCTQKLTSANPNPAPLLPQNPAPG